MTQCPNPTVLSQYPNDLTHQSSHTHNFTQHTDTSVPTLQFFRNTLQNYCHQLRHHHPSSSITYFPIPPSTLLTTPLNFNFSNFFRQLSSSLVHSACCTPYTFQFTFTFSFSIGNSLYFQLDDLVSKIPFFLLSRFFRSTSPTYPKLGSI